MLRAATSATPAPTNTLSDFGAEKLTAAGIKIPYIAGDKTGQQVCVKCFYGILLFTLAGSVGAARALRAGSDKSGNRRMHASFFGMLLPHCRYHFHYHPL